MTFVLGNPIINDDILNFHSIELPGSVFTARKELNHNLEEKSMSKIPS